MNSNYFSGMLLCAGLATASASVVTAYDDTANFGGNGFANGGATLSGNNTSTHLVADDLHYDTGLGGLSVVNFRYSVANFNSQAVTARSQIRFWAADGSGGGPGTFLAGFAATPPAFSAGTVSFFNFSVPVAEQFALPGSGVLWAGITFDDNNGTTGVTAAQLNSLGQGLFNPASVGSSADEFFQTAGSGDFAASNPAGGFFFFGGNPVANFGWTISVDSVPEPSAIAYVAVVGALALGTAVRMRRRAH
jgi:hypothetical protein